MSHIRFPLASPQSPALLLALNRQREKDAAALQEIRSRLAGRLSRLRRRQRDRLNEERAILASRAVVDGALSKTLCEVRTRREVLAQLIPLCHKLLEEVLATHVESLPSLEGRLKRAMEELPAHQFTSIDLSSSFALKLDPHSDSRQILGLPVTVSDDLPPGTARLITKEGWYALDPKRHLEELILALEKV